MLEKLLGIKDSKQSDAISDRAVCHTVQNIIAAIIDSAQHIVAERTGTVPSTYAEAIESLAGRGVVERVFADRLARAAKLRNVVVHAYENLKMEIIWEAGRKLRQDASDYEKAIGKIV